MTTRVRQPPPVLTGECECGSAAFRIENVANGFIRWITCTSCGMRAYMLHGAIDENMGMSWSRVSG